MGSVRRFRNHPLTDMVAVGAVTGRTARIWLRSRQPGRVVLAWKREGSSAPERRTSATVPEGNENDNTLTLEIADLEPVTSYRYRVLRPSGGSLGSGRFQTFPASGRTPPSRFSFALMSCNQPFDRRGTPMEGARLMLRAARQCLDERQARYVLLMGDQLYADFPEPLSLFDPAYFRTVAPEGRRTIHDCTPQEVRRIYQHRYRHFWNQEDWLALQAERPCYPILDDHDLIDNWGSREAHQEPAWRSVGVGGRLAYLDYQGSRVRDMDRLSPFHYSFEYGPVATFVMDLRSERKAGDNGRLYSEAQQRDLERFLEAHTDKAVLCLVLSVPLVHLPRFLARAVAALPHTGEDFSDRWSSGAHVRDRDRLLRIIHDHQARHPRQRFLLLSGDIHIGCLHAVRWNDGAPTLHQVISSPVTHHTSFPLQWASKSIIQLNRTISTRDRRLSAAVRPVRGVSRRMRNPFGKLNLGIVEFETEANGGGIRSLRVLFYGHRQGVPRLRFDSGNLIARH